MQLAVARRAGQVAARCRDKLLPAFSALGAEQVGLIVTLTLGHGSPPFRPSPPEGERSGCSISRSIGSARALSGPPRRERLPCGNGRIRRCDQGGTRVSQALSLSSIGVLRTVVNSQR